MIDFKEIFKFREDTKPNLIEGGFCVADRIFYALFKSPYVLWRMSCKYLRDIRNEAFLDIEKIDKPLPFITFWFRFIFKFLFHALIYLSVAIAPLAATWSAIRGITDTPILNFVGTFVAWYYAPWLLRFILELMTVAGKYGNVILKYIFFPFSIFYNFLCYLANKCKYKAESYEKRRNELYK